MEHQEDYSNPSLKELTLKARLENILVCRTSTLFEDSPCPEIFMRVFYQIIPGPNIFMLKIPTANYDIF